MLLESLFWSIKTVRCFIFITRWKWKLMEILFRFSIFALCFYNQEILK